MSNDCKRVARDSYTLRLQHLGRDQSNIDKAERSKMIHINSGKDKSENGVFFALDLNAVFGYLRTR